MGELHGEQGSLDATGAIAEQGSGGGEGEVERLRRELQGFARANFFLDGRGPSDYAELAELEQLRRDMRTSSAACLPSASRTYDEREEAIHLTWMNKMEAIPRPTMNAQDMSGSVLLGRAPRAWAAGAAAHYPPSAASDMPPSHPRSAEVPHGVVTSSRPQEAEASS
ncbi:hypothetical protein E2562_027214 [Oryza meyeriana var. granulata]|uniref:Uncharacterized protein n=1 Tax=Oryza meyeriana var. granulata TaxID=110450 RepID=A0A6G1EZH9_9ORYZ|nr:hypothetical protein E2562_027214 [Oryza meyeriana var. granulata]